MWTYRTSIHAHLCYCFLLKNPRQHFYNFILSKSHLLIQPSTRFWSFISFCLLGFKFKHSLFSYGVFVHMHWPSIQRTTSLCAEDPQHCSTNRKYREKVLLSITSCLLRVPMGSQLLPTCPCPSASSSSFQGHTWAVTISPRGSIDYHI